MSDGVFTPEWLFKAIETTLGRRCDVDVAASDWNAQCPVFVTKEMDARKQDWSRWRTIYCNPPFEVPLVEHFVHKAIKAARDGSTIAMILPMWTRYAWYQEIKVEARIHDVIGSVAFKKPDGSSVTLNRGWGNTPLMVAFLGPDIPSGTHGEPFKRPSNLERQKTKSRKMDDSSNTDGHKTPRWIVEKVEAILGAPVDLDACAASWNAQCDTFFDEETDALVQDWSPYKRIWCNPPWNSDLISQFVQKAVEAAEAGSTVALLLPGWTGYDWFQELKAKARIHDVVGGPVIFEAHDGSSIVRNNGSKHSPLVVAIVGPGIQGGTNGEPIRKPGTNGQLHSEKTDRQVCTAAPCPPVRSTQRSPFMGRKPDHAIIVDNYAEFRDDIKAFAEKKYNFLIVIGRTGVGKTETVKEIVGHHLVFDGEPSAWQMYQDIYNERPPTILLDDVSAKFFRDPTCQSFMKALTNTRPKKTLRWPTSSAAKAGLDPSFETTTRVVLLTNKWDTINEHIRAIESRAFIMVFDPTPEEVHFEVGRRGWFDDQEVYDFVWDHRGFVTRPDMRAYGRIAEQKQAGRPWHKRAVEMLIGNRRLQEIAKLLADRQFTSNKQRAKAFVERGYGARSVYYKLLREFRWYKSVDPNAEPPKLASPCRDRIEDDPCVEPCVETVAQESI
jgi:phage N-6-adenine-methyltransferase